MKTQIANKQDRQKKEFRKKKNPHKKNPQEIVIGYSVFQYLIEQLAQRMADNRQQHGPSPAGIVDLNKNSALAWDSIFDPEDILSPTEHLLNQISLQAIEMTATSPRRGNSERGSSRPGMD
jgi:hypothetical protein